MQRPRACGPVHPEAPHEFPRDFAVKLPGYRNPEALPRIQHDIHGHDASLVRSKSHGRETARSVLPAANSVIDSNSMTCFGLSL
jgi:hypothetical protein